MVGGGGGGAGGGGGGDGMAPHMQHLGGAFSNHETQGEEGGWSKERRAGA